MNPLLEYQNTIEFGHEKNKIMNRFFILIIIILTQFSLVIKLTAQNRAPSVYLDYKDFYDGDIIINSLRVASPSP